MSVIENSVGTEPDSRLCTQLAAVQLLLDRPERDVEYYDILIATVFEVLADGDPMPELQVRELICKAWPSLRLSDETWTVAIDAAERGGLIEVGSPSGARGRTLCILPPAREALSESRSYANGCVTRFRAQVADELKDREAFKTQIDATSVADAVLVVLRKVIGEVFQSRADVEPRKLGDWLCIAGVDSEAIERHASDLVPDAERSDLVSALCRLAFDNSHPVGNEIVHHLITGHLLYFFMGRPTEAAAAAEAGTLEGEILALDTPFLMSLLGADEVATRSLTLVASAKRLGVEVVLFERTVEELRSHIGQLQKFEVPELERALADGADPLLLLGLLDNRNGALAAWLRWAAQQRSGARRWKTWMKQLGLQSALRRLDALGVAPRPSAVWDATEGMLIVSAQEQLASQVSQAGIRGRSEEVIRHDALNLVEIWRARTANPPTETKIWPGGFILSPDRQINDTYDIVFGRNDFPAAITVAQFTQLLGGYMDARSREELMSNAAVAIADQILIERSVSIPVDMAEGIARAVSTEPLTSLDIEHLRLETRRRFSAVSEDGEPYDTSVLVSDLADHVRRRRRATAEADAANWVADERRREQLDAAREAKNALLRSQLDEARNRAVGAEREIGRIEDDTREVINAAKRARFVDNLVWLCLLAALIIGFAYSLKVGVSVGLGSAVLWVLGRQWAKESGISFGAWAISAGLTIAGVVNLIIPPLFGG